TSKQGTYSKWFFRNVSNSILTGHLSIFTRNYEISIHPRTCISSKWGRPHLLAPARKCLGELRVDKLKLIRSQVHVQSEGTPKKLTSLLLLSSRTLKKGPNT